MGRLPPDRPSAAEFEKRTRAGLGKLDAPLKSVLDGALVIASDPPGAEVVADGETGLVVPNTEEAWVSALSRLLQDRALRLRLGRAARDRVLQTYGIPAQRNNYRALFT